MTIVNTRRTHLAIERDTTGRHWLLWGVLRWQGCAFRGPFTLDVVWFGEPGDRWLQLGPLVFGFSAA